jgi:ABC-2 type transport system ATP-binding protein
VGGLKSEVYVGMNVLEVSYLRKKYGNLTVVDDLSFQVAKGEIFGLIGPNGAGKTTAMTMIVGLLKADAGTITVNGIPFNPRNAEMRSYFGVVPQELAIYPDLTTNQNLRFFGGLNGLQGRKLKERVDYVLNVTGLTNSADHTPSTFSGGMSRRLNFGIALLHEPQFVVLDEPTVGIDPQSRSSLLDCVRDLSKRGVGVLYASHYMEEVEAVCHRVAIMDHGRLLKQGTLDELLDRSRIDLCVKVATLPLELVRKLRDHADVRADPDKHMSIIIRERPEDQKAGRTIQLRSVLEVLEHAKIPMLGITTRETSLETLFLSLTGRKLRDA